MLRIGFVVAALAGCLTAYAPTAVEATSHSCQCVEYVKSFFGLKGAAGDAKDMGSFLAAHGFHRVDAPVPGAVIIIQPRFYASGDGAIYGHTAIVESVAASGKNGWTLVIRGANQSGQHFAAGGCGNVTEKRVGPIPRTGQVATYWVRSSR